MTPAERAKYEAYLEKAEKAYFDLIIGGQVRVFVDQNSERIEYGATNISKLLQLINSLRAILGMCAFTPATVLRPSGVLF